MTVPGATEQAMDAGGQAVDPEDEAPPGVRGTPCLALDGGGLLHYARQLGGKRVAEAEQLSDSVPQLTRFLYRLIGPSIGLIKYVQPGICKVRRAGRAGWRPRLPPQAAAPG